MPKDHQPNRCGVILIRYGEIALKGQNRGYFERQLVENLGDVLDGDFGADIRRRQGRIFVELEEGADTDEALQRLRRVFGVVSVSPASRVPLDDDDIARAAVDIARRARRLHQRTSPRTPFTFKIDARRANKGFHLTSPEINRWLGAEVLRSIDDIEVDVHDPTLRLQVEIRDNYAYLTGEVLDGPGGLPAGSSGTALGLLSGGIDSPVACWHMMKRGLRMEAVHFYTPPFTGPRSHQKVRDLAQKLARWGNGFTLHMYHFTEIQQAIDNYCPERLRLTVMRRMMLRAAESLADRRSILALVTGESLGQVASQTLHNLQATTAVLRRPVLRPLVGMDKQQIVETAKAIGTYDTSTLPYDDCCTLFVPKHPKTQPSLKEVDKAEEQLPVEQLLSKKEVDTERFDSRGRPLE